MFRERAPLLLAASVISFLRLWRLHILCEAGRALSCAQAASAAARRGPISLSACSVEAEEMLLSRSHTTRSIDGRDRTERSDCMFCGPAAGMMGYTVNRHPQPLTEPSELNFHFSSSPTTLVEMEVVRIRFAECFLRDREVFYKQ